MKNILRIATNIEVIESWKDLHPDEQRAYEAALEVRQHAYSPYSGFKVGAATLLENGEMTMGCNQENASFPAGLCAERVAVFGAGAQYPGVPIQLLAISIGDGSPPREPAAPCGICRQAISEFEHKQGSPIALILGVEKRKFYRIGSSLELLPLGFHSGYLEGDK